MTQHSKVRAPTSYRELAVRIGCKSATEFLDLIAPRGGLFGDTPKRGEWIFRGHADDRWQLLPSALRKNVILRSNYLHEWIRVNPLKHNLYIQLFYELETLTAFFWRADLRGLTLPEDSQHLRRLLDPGDPTNLRQELHSGKSFTWPRSELLSLMALAQHYRIPTRLLDWTRNPYVAAYFAAAKAASWVRSPDLAPEGITEIAVWALRAEELRIPTSIRRRYLEQLAQGLRILIVTAPGAGNPNLNAQEGLFLIERPRTYERKRLMGAVDVRTMDRIVVEYTKDRGLPGPVLFRVTLPIKESPRLLQLLHSEGIDAAALFPGFDGVAQAVKETELWRSE